jgi:hypothetical protein
MTNDKMVRIWGGGARALSRRGTKSVGTVGAQSGIRLVIIESDRPAGVVRVYCKVNIAKFASWD